MIKFIKYLYGIGFLVLFVWGLWAFLPYLWFLIGMSADKAQATRNMVAGYELPMFILVLMGLVILAILTWRMFSRAPQSPVSEETTSRFPWYTAGVSTEQRIAFEKELHRLCAACESGKRGATKPLADWLLAQQSAGIILLPDNYTQIHQELSEHYGYRLSKQAFSAAMPSKS